MFSDTLRGVAHVTSHAWAYEACAEIQRHGGTLVDVLPQLGVLTAMTVAASTLGVGAATLPRPRHVTCTCFRAGQAVDVLLPTHPAPVRPRWLQP